MHLQQETLDLTEDLERLPMKQENSYHLIRAKTFICIQKMSLKPF